MRHQTDEIYINQKIPFFKVELTMGSIKYPLNVLFVLIIKNQFQKVYIYPSTVNEKSAKLYI